MSPRDVGDTRTPLYAGLTGTFVFMLGFTCVVGIAFDYGLVGVYAGIVISYVWWTGVAAAGFRGATGPRKPPR